MAGETTPPHAPPRYTIDLSLRPRDRYRAITAAYRHEVKGLTSLFDELLLDFALPRSWLPTVNRVSKLLLRRVHDSVQTEELRGISDESGVPMYLLVAFNVILDLLMGCTSGGVRSLEKGRPFDEAKMLHFRTLDWSMDPLRRVIVQLDFVRSSSANPKKILASSISYVGFVGVLTGVRSSLSMSLNFRAVHDAASRMAHFRFYLHHILVLLGRRPSIASTLRSYLIGDHDQAGNQKSSRDDSAAKNPPTLAHIAEDITPRHTTAAYLIFCDGTRTISVDKDFGSAKIRTSEHFIATTNHDVLQPGGGQETQMSVSEGIAGTAVRKAAGLEELLEDSKERLGCATRRWRRYVYQERRKQIRNGKDISLDEAEALTSLSRLRVIELVSTWPTTNETTHFSAVMDPTDGQVVWAVVYPDPLKEIEMQHVL